MPRLTAIAAVARNGVIGDGAGLLWHLPADFARFKRVTMGGVLVMGRRTFASLGRPLPGRTSIVLTRDTAWQPPAGDVVIAHTVSAALAELARRPGQAWWCIGGGQVYRELWDYTTDLDITDVHAEPVGTVVFPVIDPAQWRHVRREPQDGFDFVGYERRTPEAAAALAAATRPLQDGSDPDAA
ncbi:MAG: dihydrofolate reductase [Propionibacteriaceae bacterium]|nr:dihydrofolate reductase [Propionibacteriaceae bacterium]